MPFDYNKHVEDKLEISEQASLGRDCTPVEVKMDCPDCFKVWNQIFMVSLTDYLQCPDCSRLVKIP
jgi:hypothetical protein